MSARPRLGLLVRLFTAFQGRPDIEVPGALDAAPVWVSPVVPLDVFEQRLDLAVAVGAQGIELTQAGQTSGERYLRASVGARGALLDALASRGLVISALNCSGMPLHPVRGRAHQDLIRETILLAEQLGVRKIVTMSGVGGDGPGSTTVNWSFFPWPDDMVALLARQWTEGIALWRELAAFAADHGVSHIALELHPVHLVYNVPSLRRLRDEIGPIIGATVDPSHLFWQSMDPIAVVRALGEAVHHVQLKDTQLIPEQMAIAGALDSRPFSDPSQRAWIQRTIGRAHGARFWGDLIDELAAVGYGDYLSIEHEDPFQSYEDGVREGAALLRPLLEREPREPAHAP